MEALTVDSDAARSTKIEPKKVKYVRCSDGKMTTDDAKTYLTKREIPRLFEVSCHTLISHILRGIEWQFFRLPW